jgi:hypothetical protein
LRIGGAGRRWVGPISEPTFNGGNDMIQEAGGAIVEADVYVSILVRWNSDQGFHIA